jgi:hypothetical protein
MLKRRTTFERAMARVR